LKNTIAFKTVAGWTGRKINKSSYYYQEAFVLPSAMMGETTPGLVKLKIQVSM
jgi:hypothetical protein